MHAWRALAQLRAYSTASQLLTLLPLIDEEDDDWISEELPLVFEMFGPKSIPAIQHYFDTNNDDVFARVSAAHFLERIGNTYTESKSICIDILSSKLEQCEELDPTFNGFLISYLLDLNAVEAMPVITKAFDKEVVDLGVMGDLEEAELILGLRTERSTPRPRFNSFGFSNFEQTDWNSKQIVRSNPKIGRNDPCPCGSGKKYKKCCL